MNRVVHKYPLLTSLALVTTEATLELPVGTQLLHFDFQRAMPCLWALVDTDEENTEERTFRIIGTGERDFGTDSVRHVGSCLTAGGTLVFHLFEVLTGQQEAYG